MDKVKVAAEDKSAEGGLFAVKALADTKEPAAEAYVVAMLPIVMEKYADKVGQDQILMTACYLFLKPNLFFPYSLFCYSVVCYCSQRQLLQQLLRLPQLC